MGSVYVDGAFMNFQPGVTKSDLIKMGYDLTQTCYVGPSINNNYCAVTKEDVLNFNAKQTVEGWEPTQTEYHIAYDQFSDLQKMMKKRQASKDFYYCTQTDAGDIAQRAGQSSLDSVKAAPRKQAVGATVGGALDIAAAAGAVGANAARSVASVVLSGTGSLAAGFAPEVVIPAALVSIAGSAVFNFVKGTVRSQYKCHADFFKGLSTYKHYQASEQEVRESALRAAQRHRIPTA